MILKRSLLAQSRQLVDAVMKSYVAWREESAAVNAAYDSWTRAAPHERAVVFNAYVVALDREEHAASQYRHLVEQVGAE